MTGARPEDLPGRWVHSHEEDEGDEQVFRPADHPFPRSRGRTSVELLPDGRYVERSPGPVDVPVASTGRWTLEGTQLRLEADGDAPGRVWDVIAAGPDRLTVREREAPG